MLPAPHAPPTPRRARTTEGWWPAATAPIHSALFHSIAIVIVIAAHSVILDRPWSRWATEAATTAPIHYRACPCVCARALVSFFHLPPLAEGRWHIRVRVYTVCL